MKNWDRKLGTSKWEQGVVTPKAPQNRHASWREHGYKQGSKNILVRMLDYMYDMLPFRKEVTDPEVKPNQIKIQNATTFRAKNERPFRLFRRRA